METRKSCKVNYIIKHVKQICILYRTLFKSYRLYNIISLHVAYPKVFRRITQYYFSKLFVVLISDIDDGILNYSEWSGLTITFLFLFLFFFRRYFWGSKLNPKITFSVSIDPKSNVNLSSVKKNQVKIVKFTETKLSLNQLQLFSHNSKSSVSRNLFFP